MAVSGTSLALSKRGRVFTVMISIASRTESFQVLRHSGAPRKPGSVGTSGLHKGKGAKGASSALSGCRGVTLVEVMVGLVIFAILIVASLPAFRKYMSTQQVEGSVNRLAANLRLARQRAATEGNNYRVSFNPAAKTYFILDDDNNNSIADDGEMVLGPITIPAEVTVTNGPFVPFPGDTLVFYPSGSASSSGEVTLVNTRGFSRMLSVIRSTGAVAVR